MVDWADLPQVEASTTLSKYEGPRDEPKVEAEILGVEENGVLCSVRPS